MLRPDQAIMNSSQQAANRLITNYCSLLTNPSPLKAQAGASPRPLANKEEERSGRVHWLLRSRTHSGCSFLPTYPNEFG